jgi:cation/acetate symporter
VLLGIIAGVAFATILAVVAGLTITASASFAHDVYASVIKKGEVSPNGEVRVARITAVVIGAVSIGLGILALQAGINIAFLVALAFAVAASANLPTIIYTLFWSRFTTQGALWSIYGGLIICVGLIIFSPVVSGTETSLFPTADFAWFPLRNPGLISIPASFLLGFIGTKLSKEPVNELKHAELEVRAFTGIGAEKAVHH